MIRGGCAGPTGSGVAPVAPLPLGALDPAGAWAVRRACELDEPQAAQIMQSAITAAERRRITFDNAGAGTL